MNATKNNQLVSNSFGCITIKEPWIRDRDMNILLCKQSFRSVLTHICNRVHGWRSAWDTICGWSTDLTKYTTKWRCGVKESQFQPKSQRWKEECRDLLIWCDLQLLGAIDENLTSETTIITCLLFSGSGSYRTRYYSVLFYSYYQEVLGSGESPLGLEGYSCVFPSLLTSQSYCKRQSFSVKLVCLFEPTSAECKLEWKVLS